MNAKISRFTYCDKRFFLYLEKVFDQLPDNLRDDILGDDSLQIISDEDFHSSNGLHYSFDKHIKYLIYLNTSILKEPVFDITYTVAHEIACYVAAKDNTGLELVDEVGKKLLVQWKFIVDLESIRPEEPIHESKGYKIGYEWAKKQKQDDLLWNYKQYFDEWSEERISPERFEQLYLDVAPFTILEQMTEEKNQEEKLIHEAALEAGVIWGVMAAIRELFHSDS
jgi:hypothetical protein